MEIAKLQVAGVVLIQYSEHYNSLEALASGIFTLINRVQSQILLI